MELRLPWCVSAEIVDTLQFLSAKHGQPSAKTRFRNEGVGVLVVCSCCAQVENEDLVFTLETMVEKFGDEIAPYAVSRLLRPGPLLCQLRVGGELRTLLQCAHTLAVAC
jgi:hypothetical protein